MPLEIVRNDITKMKVDAIVNAANGTLLGGGGVDGAIHRAAGKELLEECRALGGCMTGEAKLTRAYKLPCKYVIHTVGPVWRGGKDGEEKLLRFCYKNSLSLARERGCESIAFPLISSGAYGYPKDEALKVAVGEITEFLLKFDMTVYIVIFDRASYDIGEKLYADISEYIDDNYAAAHVLKREERHNKWREKRAAPPFGMPTLTFGGFSKNAVCDEEDVVRDEKYAASLDDVIKNIDESFSEMLLRKIDEKGMTDAECYKKANVDRKLFSKIRGDAHYRPSKSTALAFAIALELSLDETRDMLMKAGFALSHSNKFDIIIEYFITKGNYNVFEINEALFAFDQALLGA